MAAPFWGIIIMRRKMFWECSPGVANKNEPTPGSNDMLDGDYPSLTFCCPVRTHPHTLSVAESHDGNVAYCTLY